VFIDTVGVTLPVVWHIRAISICVDYEDNNGILWALWDRLLRLLHLQVSSQAPATKHVDTLSNV